MKRTALISATVSATKDQISCTLDGEAIILHTTSGIYFGLNDVGCRVWSLIQQPCSFDEILSRLLEEYEVDRSCLESDLGEWLQKMLDAGLVHVVTERSDANPA